VRRGCVGCAAYRTIDDQYLGTSYRHKVPWVGPIRAPSTSDWRPFFHVRELHTALSAHVALAVWTKSTFVVQFSGGMLTKRRGTGKAILPVAVTMDTNPRLSIGALSELATVNIETIRYYERIGVLPKPPRSPGGHRLYGGEHRQRLIFIRRSRELGFSLGQVRVLLELAGGRRKPCGKVKSITEHHIADIRRKFRDLKRLERILTGMVAKCRGGDVPDCPILDALTGEVSDPWRSNSA
jgi:MerR family transcriptional regulator, mercuric resistance operon regulatory protein